MTPKDAELMLGLILLFPALLLFCTYAYLMEYSGATYLVGEAILDLVRRVLRHKDSGPS